MRRSSLVRHAFSLLELLLLLGLIALMLGVMLPAVRRARDQARRVECVDNLHQLGCALQAYLRDNADWCPAAADKSGHRAEDWVYWQASIRSDPDGAVVRYLRRQDAARLLLCPADDLSEHPPSIDGPYPYSYSLNIFLSCSSRDGDDLTPMRLGTVPFLGQKILMIEEDGRTIDDGCWVPWPLPAGESSPISKRHDVGTRYAARWGRGNVLYGDFHADFIFRDEATMPVHFAPELP